MLVEILILLSIWLIACIFCFAVGFFIGLKANKPTETKKPLEELTEEQKLAVKKAKRETENFWNYTGDSQETEK